MASKTDTKVAPAGVKVSDLAKELGVPSKSVLELAKQLNIEVKTASSVLKPGQADRLKVKLRHATQVRVELEKKKPAEAKKPRTAKAAAVAEAPEEASAPEAVQPAVFEVPAPPVDVAPSALTEAHLPAVHAPAAPQAPEVSPPLAEQAAPLRSAQVAAEVLAPVAPETPSATEAPATAEEPSAPGAPALAGQGPRSIAILPDLAPPIQQREPSDPRFGVVIPAEAARQLHGEVQPRRKGAKPVQVESKAVDEFKAQVTYPKFAEAATEEEEGRAGVGRGRPGMRGKRAPGRAVGVRKGVSTGPRHGRALLQEEERVRGARKAKGLRPAAAPSVARAGPAEVTSPVTIKGLCEALGIKAAVLVQKFFNEGKLVGINSVLTDEEAELYALEFDPLKFGIRIKKARDVEEEMLARARKPDRPEDLLPRAPVVTVMGHVDHGKTSLLDAIRKANVAAGEAGGITQHLAAYKVHRAQGDIVFLDTPGHRAFTEMRARGANVTDLVVLVVAANDGVMPQTEEAISHCKAAGRTMIVAINKVDLPDADPERVKGQLAAKEVFVEGYGGQVGCVQVSAKTGQAIGELLDRILLEAEMAQFRANPDKAATGTVLEAHKDQGRGIEATLLVQEGALHSGDVIVCGHAYGTVRQLLDDRGQVIAEAQPATPVLVTGLSDVPLAGERFHVLGDIKQAAEIAQKRAMLLRQEGLTARRAVTLENLHAMLAEGEVAALRLILKVDVMGSLRPLEGALKELSTKEAHVEIIHSTVGAINETDVELAAASKAVVIGFNVTADPAARKLADERMVQIRTYEVIYDVVDDTRKALEGLLKPIEKETIQGHAAVQQTFRISKVGQVAGCRVLDGLITRNSSVRVIRDGKPVWTGKLASLKRAKDDAREVREGFECGLKLEGFEDVKLGDTLEAFTVEQVARTLEQAAKA